jgi:hypothetical protein
VGGKLWVYRQSDEWWYAGTVRGWNAATHVVSFEEEQLGAVDVRHTPWVHLPPSAASPVRRVNDRQLNMMPVLEDAYQIVAQVRAAER